MKNYFELTKEELQEFKEKAIKRAYWTTPFTFYVNNVVSLAEHPIWLWSAVCDLVYWNEEEDKSKQMDLDVVWYYLNELCYNSKYDLGWKTTSSLIDDITKSLSYNNSERNKIALISRYL